MSLSALAVQLLGKDPGFDLTMPGLFARTTFTSTDLGTILPKLKLGFPSTLLPLLTRCSGYLLGVVGSENTTGEAASSPGIGSRPVVRGAFRRPVPDTDGRFPCGKTAPGLPAHRDAPYARR